MNHNFLSIKESLIEEIRGLGDEVISLRNSNSLNTEFKSSRLDLVTAADKLVELRLAEFFARHRPEDGFLGEEGQAANTTSGIIWYVDPIDGTLNFARGDDNFGISVGCAVDDDPQFGLLYYPATRRFFEATTKQGASLNSEPLSTPQHATPISTLTGDLMLSRKNSVEVSAFYKFRETVGYLFSFACASHAIVQVAEGKLDFAVHSCPTVFDYGAAALIAREAGCYVARDFNNGVVLFANGPSPIIVTRTQEIANDLAPILNSFGLFG